MSNRLLMALTVLGFSLQACSSANERGDTGDSNVDCSFQACGGELVGEWRVSAGCVDDPSVASLEGCPDSTITLNADFSGTLTFAADGSYVLSTSLGGTRYYSVPIACSAGSSCDAVGQAITASCAASAASCECSSVVESTSSRSSGSYTVEDGQLVLTRSNGDAEAASSEYCVAADSLRLRLRDATGKTTLLIGTR